MVPVTRPVFRAGIAQEVPRKSHLTIVAQWRDDLDDIAVRDIGRIDDRRRDGRDVHAVIGQARNTALHGKGIDGWQVTLEIDDIFKRSFRVAQLEGRGNAVGSGRQCGIGHDRITAMLLDNSSNFHLGGSDED